MIRDIFTDYPVQDKYLILGKGPTLDTLPQMDTTGYATISLNHVVRGIPVHLAHIIDLDVVDQLGDKLFYNCDYLLMPYVPHMSWKPGPWTLESLAERHPVLKRMADGGRLLAYNLSTSIRKLGSSPVVKARHYSAEAAVDLLAKLGVKHIRTLGVDGGAEQAHSFSDLTNFNKERGYDLQWKGIRKSIQRFGVDYAPLGTESPIRVFVGASEAQEIPFQVLKHSILKHATMSTEVVSMKDWHHPMPKDKRNWPRTPFSFQRFMIPEKCGYKGHAIYMDSDMLVFGDVKELWMVGLSIPGIGTARGEDTDKHKAQFSCMTISCWNLGKMNIERAIDELNTGKLSYEDLVFGMKRFLGEHNVKGGIDPNWNSLEEYIPGQTKLLHYTEMYNQPWLRNPNHPLGHLWFLELVEAVNDGSIDRKLVEEHVAKGYILPKCKEVLDDPAQALA